MDDQHLNAGARPHSSAETADVVVHVPVIYVRAGGAHEKEKQRKPENPSKTEYFFRFSCRDVN
jgi:hypothetical protein